MIGANIRLARKKSGLSLRALADALDGRVSAQAIGKYERDEMTPGSGVLLALCKALDVSLTYLMDTQDIELSGVDFRTKANTTAKDRADVEVAVIEWLGRYLQIENILDLGSAGWMDPQLTSRKLSTFEDAETLADELRREWALGCDVIPDMTGLLEEKGLKVLVEALPLRVSGFTCLVRRGSNQPELPIVVVNKLFPLERRRMTLAHELGHRVIDPRNLDDKEEEKAATCFAGAFLIPRDHLEREVGAHRNHFGYNELINLKRLYRVSGAALLVRLKNTGIISNANMVYAFQSVARGWRTREPEELEPKVSRGQQEKPCRFERLCYRALAEGLISLSKAAELLRLSIDEVERGLKGPGRANAGHRY